MMKENQNLEKTKKSRKMEGDDKVVTDNQKNWKKPSDGKNSTKSGFAKIVEENRDGWQSKQGKKFKISHKKMERIK